MASLDGATTMGPVRLTVADVDRAQRFYRRAIGLAPLPDDGDVVRLGSAPDLPLVELVGRPDAPARPRGSTGLFHLALLVPSRPELARALERVARAGWSFTGASDHLVSEALYLNDPEGNGIEIYRDRPREEWRQENGELAMATLPLDLEGVMGELPRDGGGEGMLAGTRMGHVHLQVGDIAAAERFYHGLLGFDVMVRGYPGALFVSAGGYHHHVGLNTWAGEGAPPAPAGSRGLDYAQVTLAGPGELADVAGRLAGAGVETCEQDGGLAVEDPSGNRLLLRVAA